MPRWGSEFAIGAGRLWALGSTRPVRRTSWRTSFPGEGGPVFEFTWSLHTVA
jgi:hypothetical protein